MPTQDQLRDMDFIYEGAPYIGQTNPNIDILDMGFIYEGIPFIVSQSTDAPAAVTKVIQIMMIGF